MAPSSQAICSLFLFYLSTFSLVNFISPWNRAISCSGFEDSSSWICLQNLFCFVRRLKFLTLVDLVEVVDPLFLYLPYGWIILCLVWDVDTQILNDLWFGLPNS